MKKRFLLISLALLMILGVFTWVDFKSANADRIPFLPLNYKNVNSIRIRDAGVSSNGRADQICSEKEIIRIVKIINEIKDFNPESTESRQLNNHSGPGPSLLVTIEMKENKYIVIYEDYDHKDKISDRYTPSYIINHSVMEQIFKSKDLSV